MTLESKAPAIGYADVNREVLKTLTLPGRRFLAIAGLLAFGTAVGGACWFYQIFVGVGAAGMNVPVFWSFTSSARPSGRPWPEARRP
ncbi:MAG: hypothetical protein ACYTHN_01820 [Planctomycetota bacterium]|jgi:hypothetical protein